ncbi:peptidoglycan DD-metalloendopeptidase family protein [Actinomadura sp. HBU206391]|uniref:peptidoglycan DD-metalloendopeptidase family protein n=1 Tax=Actinomadura sp. HBU206391 TaxID=2731692 RepID=UPI0016500899|nr:peptidoglycan DD-metalloendopeptidase family protein [Actinomadura sp. HBU206391]MBC6462631.1 peptidoglycan DD-metalloendopeptidase family protein [Actinomadura sp. HBU206391]
MTRRNQNKVVFLERTARVANRVAVAGMVVVMVVVLALVAVVERVLLARGEDAPPDGEILLEVPEQSPRKPPSVPSRRRTPPTETLGQQVRTFTLAQRGPAARQLYGVRPSQQPIVGTTRFSRDRAWALGTTAIPAPTDQPVMPQVTLFMARWGEGGWEMALAGSPEFSPLVRLAPTALIPAEEKRLLSRYSDSDADSGSTAGLMLPWRAGDAWTITATRGASDSARPLGAVAFRGGDGRVLAAGDGRLYRFCTTESDKGLVLIIHPNGLATQYYEMTKVTDVPDGGVVKQGDYLGRIGTDRPCGGAPAGRPQVRFAIRQGADDVPLNGLRIGGWTFQERAKPLLGWAERGVLQVMPGEPLANFGPSDIAPSDPLLTSNVHDIQVKQTKGGP